MIMKKIFSIVLLSVIVLLSGCASKVTSDAIVVDNVQIINKHKKNIAINAQSDGSDITDEELIKAIEKSIISNNLFTEIINAKNANYLLDVAIINIEKPSFGLTFTVNMEATWSLKDSLSNEFIMRKSIKSSHTATFEDAFAAMKRLKLAVEGAIRENIRLGILEISKIEPKNN